MRTHGVRRFGFPKFAQPLRDENRGNAERLAAEHGIEVQLVRHHEQRKEAIVAKTLDQRGDAPEITLDAIRRLVAREALRGSEGA